MGKAPKEMEPPPGSTMEERWAEEDAQAPFGFNPNTGDPNVFDVEAIEEELSDVDADEEAKDE